MEFTVPAVDLMVILPLLLVVGTGIALMVIDLFLRDTQRYLLGWLALVGLIPALAVVLTMWDDRMTTFQPAGGHPMIIADNYSHFLNVIFLLTGLFTVLLSIHYTNRQGESARGEFYMLLLFSISGMMLMGMANDLILVFLAIELLSIPLYILCGFARPRLESEESAMKYFLLGAFSSGFLVFGIALVYGATGATALPIVLDSIGAAGPIGLAGVGLLLVGFAFKVAAVPFHAWTPDVYQGAPTVVTAFMSVGAKVGGFAAMIRVFIAAFPDVDGTWVPVVAVMSALTMILGNVVALAQDDIKRMLAYSSIAHAGYILIAVSAGESGVGSALFYMLAYLFTNMGAFGIVVAMERQEGVGLDLESYKGLARRSPIIGITLAYFMLSLTGVPPTGGFMGKFFVFQSAIDSGLLWLAIVGVVTSVISGYFYLRVVYLMFMYEGDGEPHMRPGISITVGLAALATIILGIFPGPWFEFARDAVVNGASLIAGG